jgi:hypothetical protein
MKRGGSNFSIAERQFAKREEALKELIRTRFAQPYEDELRRVSEATGPDSALERQITSLSEFVRRRLTRCGLNVICRKGGRSDLPLVRETIRAAHVDYAAADADYLRRFGEFSDITLLIQAVERPSTGPDGIIEWDRDAAKFDGAARTIVHLAKDRAAEILGMAARPELVSRVILHLSDKRFKQLPDSMILGLLSSQADDVRKAVALRCVKALPKKRSERLLVTYTAPDKHRFYNVIRWLDLAVSTPREVAVQAASRAITNRWPAP